MSQHPMMEEILRQGRLKKTVAAVEEPMIACCKDIAGRKISDVIITGSGDSYYVGLAMKPLFQALCGSRHVQVQSSNEFAKYGLQEVNASSLIIAISISGNVMRTIECVEQAQKRGAYVIGVTNNRTSRLADVAARPVFLDLDTEPTWTCGTLTYTGSMYALARTAIALSDREASAKGELVGRLDCVLGQLEEVIRGCEDTCRAAARNMRIIDNQPPMIVLGGGPNLGTAKYGAAKFLEVCSTLAIGQEVEEFCHGEFWVLDRSNLVFMIAPQGACFERCAQVAGIVREFGCDLFVLSDDSTLCELGKFSICMPTCNELLSPFFYALPFQLVAYYYSYEKGLNPDTREHTDPFRKKCSRMLTRGKVTEL